MALKRFPPFFFGDELQEECVSAILLLGMKGLSFEKFQQFRLLSLVSKTKVRIPASLYTPEFLKNRS